MIVQSDADGGKPAQIPDAEDQAAGFPGNLTLAERGDSPEQNAKGPQN
jgi:hypothetical protein